MKSLKVSVVIPTYNRLEFLKQAIDSLLNQSHPPDEIIVVDDGSSDGTKEYLKKISKKYKIIKYYYFTKNCGPSKARNLGIKNATGDIICFFDDDQIAHKNWIKEIVKTFKENRDIGGVGGKLIELEPNNMVEKYLKLNFNINYSRDLPYLGGNIAFLRHVLLKVGGFDDRLKTGEDVDLSFRIYLRNYKIIYNDNMIVYHKSLCNFVKLIRKGYNLGIGWSNLNRKYPSYFNPVTRIFFNTMKIFKNFIKIPSNITIFVIKNKNKYLLLEPILDITFRFSIIIGIIHGILNSKNGDVKIIYCGKIDNLREDKLLKILKEKILNYKWKLRFYHV